MKHQANKVLPSDLQHPCSLTVLMHRRTWVSYLVKAWLPARGILHLLHFCRPTKLSQSGRWKLFHQSPGSCPWWWAPRGAAGQKRYHGCRLKHLWQPGPASWWAGHHIPRSAGFMLPTLCVLRCGCNPTWPTAWQGPMLIWVTEQHESLPELCYSAP